MAVTKASSLFTVLRSQVPTFVAAIEETLEKTYQLNVSNYEADHVCWRTETAEEYSSLTQDLLESPDDCKLLIESEIGGRPIATFALAKAISVGSRSISVVEIPSPKTGSAYRRGLEHVEFVIPRPSSVVSPIHNHQSTLDAFMERHPKIPWDTKAKSKSINPDISLKLEVEGFGNCSVKFHLFPLAEVIEYEKKEGIAKV
jgi:uncharacterized protein